MMEKNPDEIKSTNMTLRKTYFNRSRAFTILSIVFSVIVLMSFGINNGAKNNNPGNDKKDSVASVKAFMQVYKVLMSPRCMNCHPAGDVPLTGDDSHLHNMTPQRGKDGK